MAAFVTRLQPRWLPIQAARQLPEQSTTLRVAPTATGDTRIQGALHSITSSASASSLSGMVRPSVFAVLRLITNSNLVDCSTGRSAGFERSAFLPGFIRPALPARRDLECADPAQTRLPT